MAVPSIRPVFCPGDPSAINFMALGLADALLLPVSGVVAALGLMRGCSWARWAVWLHAGAALYAALLALGLWMTDRRLWLGAGLMVPVLILPLNIALTATRSNAKANSSVFLVVIKTTGQIVLFWGFFLFVVPHAIVLLERSLGRPAPVDSTARSVAAVVLFAAGGTLGLTSAWVMAVRGAGTPLPTDPAKRLVLTGPYAYVRNPMAVGGLLQGLAVALWHGSWPLLLYVLLGATLWQLGPRPVEEAELESRFGEQYKAYRRNVRCWRPRSSGYVAENLVRTLTPPDSAASSRR